MNLKERLRNNEALWNGYYRIRGLVDKKYSDVLRDRQIGLRLTNAFDAVQGGPFQGLKLKFVGDVVQPPTVIGSYESELHPWITKWLSAPLDVVIDVGGSVGFYAIGFALKGGKQVKVFEVDPEAVKVCLANAESNGVCDQLEMKGWCDGKELAPFAEQRALLISDCEGYEETLFTADILPSIKKWDLLIEVHDNVKAGIGEKLKSLLSETHKLEVIQPGSRNVKNWPATSVLNEADRLFAITERRAAGNYWIIATPK